MISYRVRVFTRVHEGVSYHDADDLEAILNQNGADGYVLTHALQTSNGYLLVFGRDNDRR